MTAQIIPVDPDDARTLARHATETTSTCQIQELRTARLRHLRGSGAGFSGRRLDENNVKSLMESMGEHGFWKSSPLRVRPIKIRELNDGNIDGWEIISGQHRFEAAWRLNYATVPCVIAADDDLHAELIMIDENLCRADLEPVEMARQTARRKVIYEELHPGAGHGGDRKSSNRKISNLKSTRFSKETAAKTGRSESSVQKDARRGEVLGDDLNDIAGTSLDKGVELDALVKMAPLARREIIDRAKAGEKVSAVPPPSDAFKRAEAARKEKAKRDAAAALQPGHDILPVGAPLPEVNHPNRSPKPLPALLSRQTWSM